MTDSHNQSFFGQNAALMVQSSSKFDDYIFIQCIKRKGGNVWEKPSQGEGKNIKISLGEIVMILKVLNKRRISWSTYHNYQEGTSISFKWQQDILWANIGEYAKKLQSPEIEIFQLLLQHLLEEKIEFATGLRSNPGSLSSDTSSKKSKNHIVPSSKHKNLIAGNKINNEKIMSLKHSPTNNSNQSYYQNSPGSKSNNNLYVEESSFPLDYGSNQKPSKKVSGKIQRITKKALLIQFQDGIEAWIPKSTVHNEFTPDEHQLQSFFIDIWVLEKNKVTFAD